MCTRISVHSYKTCVFTDLCIALSMGMAGYSGRVQTMDAICSPRPCPCCCNACRRSMELALLYMASPGTFPDLHKSRWACDQDSDDVFDGLLLHRSAPSPIPVSLGSTLLHFALCWQMRDLSPAE